MEFGAAHSEYLRIFGTEARTAGAAGWQSNAFSRGVYDRASLLYASDTRGALPFFPRIGGTVFRTLEIPTTLPTFDELMGRREYPPGAMVPHYRSLVRNDRVNVFTLHAEIEGMGRRTIHIPRIIANPFRMTPMGVKFQFTNIEKPKRKQREIKMSSRLTGFYWVEGETVPQNLGLAQGATSIDLFRQADHSKNDTAVQTVMVRNQNYMMIVRVTVIETD